MPHLVSDGSDLYLGVVVTNISESEQVLPGTTRTISFDLMYPKVDYSSLEVGSRFEIREGPRSIGYGEVIIQNPDYTDTKRS
jgi:translation elongation factor EF-Tu-like GTPase